MIYYLLFIAFYEQKLKTEFSFDAAHRLVGYDGKCKQLHGHIWRVIIKVKGKSENRPEYKYKKQDNEENGNDE